MGACSSSEGGGAGGEIDSEEEARHSKSIDKLIREDEKRLGREVKMLLLGPGSSGKSTILKQMKVIHLKGFTPAELEEYRVNIFRNVGEAMQLCLQLMFELGIELEDPANNELSPLFDHIPDLHGGEPFPPQYLAPLQQLWDDPGVQACVQRGKEASLPENMAYYFSDLPRLFAQKGYIPTDQDALRCRQKTTGITETQFRSADLQYRLFDVGGQRSERKKWIHCFENVTAVLFLAAVSGYDQPLLEDKDSNQMQEALMLFDSICNSQWFVRTSIILFLNKVDVFKDRIFVSSIRAYFPDYTGDDTDYNAAREYFKDRFTRLNRSQSKEIYTNYTTAIDTNLIRVVMASVYDIIVTRNLNDIILYTFPFSSLAVPKDRGTGHVVFDLNLPSSCLVVAGSITDWDSKTIIGQKARGPTVTKDGAALNAARRSGAAIETDKKGTGNKANAGPDHAKIAKLDRENDVAPPALVSMELGKVLQQARQNFKDSEGKPKPMSQGDLARMINQKATVVQEYENMKATPNPQILGQMERILKVKLRGTGIGQPLGGPKKAK